METKKIRSHRKWLLFYVLFSTVYFIWRIFFTIPIGYGWFSISCGLILLIVELLGMSECFIHFLNVTKLIVPVKPEVVDKELYPHVDVYIATYNEPEELLYKTIIGCKNMAYPDLSKVHIYILDDGHRPNVKQLAKHLGVHYISRVDNEHAKAGNLNHALSLTTSPYVVTLDADMIPMKHFLLESIPFFIENEQKRQLERERGIEEKNLSQKLGFIQLPQVFYNPDIFQYYLFSEDRIPNEQDYFYRDIQLGKNESNSVIYGGSNTILSREALNEIGGFVTGIITEDIATGMLIQSKGYLSYAVDSIQASGLSPHDLEGILKQRNRWARGCIQTFRRYCPLLLKGLTWKQRINYTNAIFYWYNCLKRIIYLSAPIMFTVFNVVVVKANLIQVIVFWLPMYVMIRMTLRRFSGNVRSIKWTNVYEIIMMPSLIPAVLLESIGLSMKKFEVTRKDKQVVHKNSDILKLAIPHFILLALTFIGMIRSFYHLFLGDGSEYVIALFWLATNSYGLLMALFFVLGRPVYRMSDRFKIETDVTIEVDHELKSLKTYDISEKGIAVQSDFPYLIPSDQIYPISLTREDYQASFKGKLIRVDSDDTYRYVFEVNEISEENYQELIKILYDRVPHLPSEIVDKSIYNDIERNIRFRRQKNRQFSRTLPRVDLNLEVVSTQNDHLNIENFNYHYFLVKGKHGFTEVEIPLLTHPQIMLRCQFKQIIERQIEEQELEFSLFEILNYQEIPLSIWNEEVKMWLTKV